MAASLRITSVFVAIDRAFGAMSDGPDPICIDCTPHTASGMPAARLTLREVRTWMLNHRGRDTYPARNAIWRHLVEQARHQPDWMTAALGMALPALVRAATEITRSGTVNADDISAEMVAAFVGAVHGRINPADERIYDRLRWYATRAGIAARDQDLRYEPVADIGEAAAASPRLPYGHPDLILARAVAGHVISARDADVILRTRLDQEPIDVVAADTGIDPAVLRMRRIRAERILAAAIRAGHLNIDPGRRPSSAE